MPILSNWLLSIGNLEIANLLTDYYKVVELYDFKSNNTFIS